LKDEPIYDEPSYEKYAVERRRCFGTKAHDENHQNVSFIDSPEILWEEDEVEEVLTRIGNGSFKVEDACG
jgi:hypothetical protein